MGTRSRTGTRGKQARSRAGTHAHPAPNSGTPVRNPQGVDGFNALPDENAEQGQYRNELARVGIQHEASNRDLGCWNADQGDPDLVAPLFP